MNSLQILSILSFEKVLELKEVLKPKKLYSILYEAQDLPHFTYVSKLLYETKEKLSEYLFLIVNRNAPEKITICEYCELEKDWSEENIKAHFIFHGHFGYKGTTYKIKEFFVE